MGPQRIKQKIGMNLTPEQTIAYDKAAVLCSRSEYCTSEIREKLKLWGLSPEEAVSVIEKLIAEKYVDDERFARAYAKDKFKFNRWGTVSYTHLTLPTICSVQISVVAVSLKKKNKKTYLKCQTNQETRRINKQRDDNQHSLPTVHRKQG
eukprot:TRINITY_DN17149_c0_g1_i3.p1 TRINITY_DN17149_c0_g1~~TRINITY_DN17149_c0_g1_i3.p1  ORF type:complete len:150 (-),score=12.85 TRINITY_DN17149_c0_g1_i3:18-467(-)